MPLLIGRDEGAAAGRGRLAGASGLREGEEREIGGEEITKGGGRK